MTDVHPFYVANRPETSEETFEVVHPYDGRVIGVASVPTAEQVERAVSAAAAVAPAAARLTAAARAEALMHVSRRLAERKEEIAHLITAENGKPIKWSLGEAGRASSVFRFAAEEARRWNGELKRLDTDPAAAGRLALVRRFPHGSGARHRAVQLPAEPGRPQGRAGHRRRCADRAEAGAGDTAVRAACSVSCWPRPTCRRACGRCCRCPTTVAATLVPDPRLPVISFTGSGAGRLRDPRGRAAQARHARARRQRRGRGVLGDFAADADLDWAAARIAMFANYQAGQSCISVQRVLVDRSVYERLRRPGSSRRSRRRRPATRADAATDVGPLVDENAAERVVAWVDEAVAARSEAADRRRPRRCDRLPDACSSTCRRTPRSPARRSSVRC